jgi:hypothetical protein
MTNNRDNEKQPHGVTGDTVQQAADVSRPTTTAGHAIDNSVVPQAPLDPKTWGAGEDATAEDKAGIANRTGQQDRS